MSRFITLSVALAACAKPAATTTCPVQPAPPPVAPVAQPAALMTPPPPLPAPEPPVTSGYDQPPPHVLAVLHAPTPPQPYVSPTHDTILLVSWVQYPSITQVAEPYLKLAGVRV